MQSLNWYKNRLQRMSVPEIAYRAVRLAGGVVRRLEAPAVAPEPALPASDSFQPWVIVPQDVDTSPYRQAADRIVRGTYTIFDLEEVDLGRPPEWNRDPLTGIRAPLRHATLIDYRDERSVGNIKYLWEANRHLHLVTLAQAYALTSDHAYVAELRTQLESWLEQCPHPRGPNWTSPLELGIRLVNWSISWQLIGGHESAAFDGEGGRQFKAAWLESIYLHVRQIMRNLSRFSSANNHLIGELAGVLVAARTWPYWSEMRAWGTRAKQDLIEETLRQNALDGGNREQAIAYQQFVLDFLLVAGLTVRGTPNDFPAVYWNRIERMIDFLASMTDAGGNIPMIGDADDGFVTRLAPAPDFCPYQSLLASGAVLFGRPDLASKAAYFDDKSKWLLERDGGASRFLALAQQANRPYVPRRSFPESGYYLLGSGFETKNEVRMLVDAGPLGYLSLAAHGHADALAIILSVSGREFLIDPGTFTYLGQPAWRSYFRGTSAHNTVTVDGMDQSLQGGSFLWTEHAIARCLRFDSDGNEDDFVGEHDGYKRLPDPVIHTRKIHRRGHSFEIVDEFACAGSHSIELWWHFADRCAVELADGAVYAVNQCASVRLLPQTGDLKLFRGSEGPMAGWVSRRFQSKEPAVSARVSVAIRGASRVTTLIECQPDVLPR